MRIPAASRALSWITQVGLSDLNGGRTFHWRVQPPSEELSAVDEPWRRVEGLGPAAVLANDGRDPGAVLAVDRGTIYVVEAECAQGAP